MLVFADYEEGLAGDGARDPAAPAGRVMTPRRTGSRRRAPPCCWWTCRWISLARWRAGPGRRRHDARPRRRSATRRCLADAARAAGVPCLFARLITRAGDETDMSAGMESAARARRRSAALPRRHARRGICRAAAAGGRGGFLQEPLRRLCRHRAGRRICGAEARHAGDRGADHRMLRRFHRARCLRARLSCLHRRGRGGGL